ncbi:MAG: guanylate kinase [[Clostridium] aminophilum]|uniref:guanylate kinase n=1 Tax=[Clostridium] aminophilum TaxID=1526 RepID=UPI0026EBDBB3|nr:guanylate kinase [[Clostridium] aminophilum]MDD6195464.1 guanylate kinase [[Clostridium] aminophilum]
MGKIYYLMGKSACGKDTLYKRIRQDLPQLAVAVPYTTRPMREGETDGVEYHFTTEQDLDRIRRDGRVIEARTYQTVAGPWTYATVDDGSFDLEKRDFLMIGTLESYCSIRDYFPEGAVVPLLIEVEDGIRLERAIRREREQEKPQYAELCRRFLADEQDFSEENLRNAGVATAYPNLDFDACAERLEDVIRNGSADSE